MRALATLLVLLSLAPQLRAALTADQKELDLRILAAQFAKHYAPYEWKKELFGFDLYNLSPWIARARATATDLGFYQVCGEYVASLRDSHSSFSFPSSYRISLPLHADYYEDVPRIDFINRAQLPVASFPFQIGDEIVAVDGVPITDVVYRNALTVYAGNDSSRRRTALQRVFGASESVHTHTREVGDEVALTVRSRATGEEAVYNIRVTKTGTPLAEGGTTPLPVYRIVRDAFPRPSFDDLTDPWLAPLAGLRNDSVPATEWGEALAGAQEVLGFGNRPGFVLPSNFVQRLGRLSTEAFFSGSYTAGGKRIGFIRIPTFAPAIGAAAALRQFETEMEFFNENTDGLIVDIMRNGGGDSCYNEEIQRRLIPYPFQGIGREIRATYTWVAAYHDTWQRALQLDAPPHVVALWESHYRDIETAYRELRGRSGPLPICAETLDRLPHASAYRKPLLVLADEYSASASDGFAAVIQDAGRGPIFGFRTNGAGGSIMNFDAGPYSESLSSATTTMHHRRAPVSMPGFPVTSYTENAGVYPDLPYDYMFLDNLLANGTLFRDAATEALIALIDRGQ